MTGPRDSQHLLREVPPSLWGPWQWAWGREQRTYPEGALGDVDASPGDDDGVFNRLGGHVGAAEGTIAVGDDLDVNGAALCVLWASPKARFLECPGLLEHQRPLLAVGHPPYPPPTHSQAPPSHRPQTRTA